MKFEKLMPHFIIYFILMMAAFFYFKPVVFEGKSLREHDNVQARGMQAECHKYEKAVNKNINWTNQAFLGMPTYQIYGNYSKNMAKKVCEWVFMFNQPVNTPHVVLFFIMLFTYFGLLAFGIDKWIAVVGALSFGFATNNLVLFEAGHSTKLHAMVYMAPILGGTYMTFRGKILLGGSIVAFCLAAQLGANHLQITYYTFLMVGFLGLAFLVDTILTKNWSVFIKSAGVLSIAAILAVFSNLALLWTTFEYSSETIRGGTELKTFILEKSDLDVLISKGLTSDDVAKVNKYGIVNKTIKTEKLFLDYMAASIGPEKAEKYKKDILTLASASKNKGLDKDYIFGWSYGIMETFTLLVPNIYGGANGKYFADDASKPGIQIGKSNSAKAMNAMLAKAEPQQAQNISNELFSMTSQYWGAQPFTSGPVYLGAVICFLFILGLLIVKGPVKWAFALVSAFFIILSWGDNFKSFNYFMVDHFPMYNKFRAVTMALGPLQIIAVIMAMLGLSTFVSYKLEDRQTKGVFLEKLFDIFKIEASRLNYLYLAAGISISLCLYVILYSQTADMTGGDDSKLIELSSKAPQWASFYEAIKSDRAALMFSDALRSLIFIILAAVTLWLIATDKVKQTVAIISVVGLLSLVDLLMIDNQYITEQSFEKKREIVEAPPATKADLKVLNDKTLHYRVYDLIAGMRGGQAGNPFANSEGAFFHKVIGGYHAAKPILTQELAEMYFRGKEINPDYLPLLGMLNVKYIIQTPEVALENPEALGNSWFVEEIKFVETADEELEILPSIIPRSTAVTRKSNEAYLKGLINEKTPGDYIKLVNYHPEKLEFQSENAKERFAVFSEIYYPNKKGWNVYIDGKLVKEGFIKVNYLLRGMRIPAGKHNIEMRFEPKSYSLGELSALICSLIIISALGFSIWFNLKKKAENTKLESVGEEQNKQKNIEETAKENSKKPKKK